FPHSIYTIKLIRRGIDIRGGKDISVLKAHKVSEVMDSDFQTMPASTPLAMIFDIIEHSHESYYVVVDTVGHIKGVLSFQDIRSLLSQHSLDYLVIAQDLVKEAPVVVYSDDDLEQAFSLFGIRDLKLIPVVDKDHPDRVMGVIRREALVDYYNKRLIETLRR
ncbi:MAG: CBS domain-containing protein, partial [Candidatus Zixiibacteriota bacterium]